MEADTLAFGLWNGFVIGLFAGMYLMSRWMRKKDKEQFKGLKFIGGKVKVLKDVS